MAIYVNIIPDQGARELAIDLNIVPYEGEKVALPDLNVEPADEEGAQIHHPLDQHQIHLLEEVGVHKGRAHYLQQAEQVGVHGFDLNIAPCEEQEQTREVIRVEDDQQQDGDISFHGEQEQHEFDLNINPFEQQHEIEQMINMIEDMCDYGVYTDYVDITFDEEELLDSDVDEDEHANENNTHHRKNLTNLQRQQIYEALLESSNRGRLKRNTTNIVAQMFQVSTNQVRSVWRRVKQRRSQGRPVDVRSRRKNCGRKRKLIDLSNVLSIPLHRRRTIRSLANALGLKKSTLHRWFKQGLLRRHSSTLKPLLRDENKKERLRWCVSMLDEQTLPNESMFREMKNIIHMDEKWFNTTSKDTTYDPAILNRVFLTLQGCMIEVMKDNGGNRYKIPHMDKDKLEALDMLPKRFPCDRRLYESVMASLAK